MVTSAEVKETVRGLGMDLCGIAPVERFSGAPEGFRPVDIFPACKSVVVFARKLPADVLRASSCVPYTVVNNMLTFEVDRLTIEISLKLETMGIPNVPIPSDDPYEHWEADRSYGRAILSLRHAGHLAGLGVLGKNTLLINDTYGNMLQIGAVLAETDLKGDPLAEYEGCVTDCRLCLDVCPVGALDSETVNQQLCRPRSIYRTEKGYILKKCFECRSVCPSATGIKI